MCLAFYNDIYLCCNVFVWTNYKGHVLMLYYVCVCIWYMIWFNSINAYDGFWSHVDYNVFVYVFGMWYNLLQC